MQSVGDTPLTNHLVSTVMRAAVDLCWLIPLAYIMSASTDAPINDGSVAAASLFIPALFAAVVWHFRPAASVRSSTLPFAMLWIGMTWWLQNRAALEYGVMDLIIAGDFPPAALSFVHLSLCVYRGFFAARRPTERMTLSDLLRGTVLTGTSLLILRYTAEWYPVWPVLVLPLALVGSSVSARAYIISPSLDASRLSWQARWAVIAALVIIPFAITLILIGMSSPGFWTAAASVLAGVWKYIAEAITLLAYPFAYGAYLIYRLLLRFIPEDAEAPPVEEPGPPDMDEWQYVDDAPASAVLSIILRILTVLVMLGVVAWVFRALRQPQETPPAEEWEEERVSLWDPDAFRRRLRDIISPPGDDAGTPTYRTDTERRIRSWFRELTGLASPVHRYTSTQTPRVFCGRLVEKAVSLSKRTTSGLFTLLGAYELVRYGPPIEDRRLQEQAEEAMETLRVERWADHGRGDSSPTNSG